MLSTIGISNTVGRVFWGFIGDRNFINRMYLYGVVIVVCGLATIVEPICTGFVDLFIYALIFGFTSGKFLIYSAKLKNVSKKLVI